MRLLFLLAVASATASRGQALPRFDLLLTVDATVGTTPKVFWSGDRLCVPANDETRGFACHDLGAVPRKAPTFTKAARKLEPESGNAVPFNWNKRLIQLDTKSGTMLVDSTRGASKFSSVNDLACPRSGGAATRYLLVRGDKPSQLALLRLDKYPSRSDCEGHDVACPQDGEREAFTETWSVLTLTDRCEIVEAAVASDGGL